MGYLDKLDPGLVPDLFRPVEQPAEPRGMLRGIADLGLDVASGVARGVKFTADAFGAGNAVSNAAGDVDSYVRSFLSAQAQADDQRISQIMAEAQDKGIWEQVKAGAEAFAQAPFRTAANALGTSVPAIATALIPGVGQASVAARLGMLGTMGAAQGAGTIKGSIYDAVKAEQMKQPGMTEADAEAAAIKAQEYGGENAGNIALGASLGAAGMATGVQPFIARAFAKPAAAVVTQATKQVERGMLKSIGLGVLKETPLEAMQGGQEQYAQNIALQNEGFDVPTWRGVAGQAAMEGLAAAGPGAVVGAFDRGAAGNAAPPSIEDIGKANTLDEAIKAAQDAVDASTGMLGWNKRYEPEGGFQSQEALYAFSDGSVATLDDTVTELSNRVAKDNLEQWFARAPEPMTPEKAGDIVAIAAERNIDMISVPLPDGSGYTVVPKKWADAPILNDYLEQAAAAFQTAQEQRARVEQIQNKPREPRGALAEPPLIDPKAPNAVAQYIERLRGTNTPAARAFVQEFEAGRIAAEDVLRIMAPRQEPTADERLATAAAQAPKPADPQPGDILTSDGMPYGTRSGAYVRAKREGLAPENVIEVTGGWAVRPRIDDAGSTGADGEAGTADLGRSPGGEQLRERVGADVVVDARPADAPGVDGMGADGVEAGGAAAPDDALTELAAKAKQAKERVRQLLDAKTPDPDSIMAAAEQENAAADALRERIVQAPDDGFGLSAKTPNGRNITLTPSAQRPGQWQLTRFDDKGEPLGDSQYTTKAKAVDDFVREADTTTLELANEVPATDQRPTSDIPTLKQRWQRAVSRGDMAGATQINDQIVAAKAAQTNAAVPADQASAGEAAAPAAGAGAAEAPAGVPAAGDAASVEAGGITPAAPAQTEQFIPAPNGYRVRVSQHKRGSNVLDPTSDIGAFIYEVRKGASDGRPLAMVLNKDGKLVELGKALNEDNSSNGTAWVPSSPEVAETVRALLEKRAGTKVGSPERAAVDAEIAAAVKGSQADSATTNAQPVASAAGTAGTAVEGAGVATRAPDEKSRWLKNVSDTNRLIGPTGPQIGGIADNGRLNFLGDPNSTKQGRALLGAVEAARKAGATDAEIAQAATAAPTTRTISSAPATPEGVKEAAPANTGATTPAAEQTATAVAGIEPKAGAPEAAPAATAPAPLFKDRTNGLPVVVPNKATADAMARSKELAGKVTVRKAAPQEMQEGTASFVGYKEGEARSLGYVLEMTPEAAPSSAADPAAIRAELRAVEQQILDAAPRKFSAGGGDIESAVKSREVPVSLKIRRKALKEQLRAAPAADTAPAAPDAPVTGEFPSEPTPTNDAQQDTQTRPKRVIELRKRASVLKALLACLG